MMHSSERSSVYDLAAVIVSIYICLIYLSVVAIFNALIWSIVLDGSSVYLYNEDVILCVYNIHVYVVQFSLPRPIVQGKPCDLECQFQNLNIYACASY